MSRIERTNEKYSRTLVKDILRRAGEPPEARFDNVEDMLAWLNQPDGDRDEPQPR